MGILRNSPERHTFQQQSYLEVLSRNPDDEGALAMVELFKSEKQRRAEKEADPEWQKDNLEYDLRSTDWIVEKVKSSEVYAQNLYAAMCNVEFTKNDVWPLLQEQRWGCSWRYAGGIVADMLGKGDYIDWYCSGIHNSFTDEEYQALSKEEQEQYLFVKNNHVGEGFVTDEIRADLLKLGWLVVDE